MSDIEWGRDTRDAGAEEIVRGMGLTATYARVSMSDIDMVDSKRNRGRIDQSDEGTVQEYADAMMRGDRFPAICCRRTGRKSKPLTIAGGWTRTQAKLRAGETDVVALVVLCDDAEFDLLCKRLNTVNGVRTTTRERVLQAAELVMRRGYGAPQAARLMCVDPHTVRSEVVRVQVIQKAAAAGVQLKPEDLSQNDAKAIAKFSDQPVIASALMQYAASPRNGFIPVAKFAEHVKAAPTEAEKLAVIEATKRSGPAAVVRERLRRRASLLFSHLGSIENMVKKWPTLKLLNIEASERSELAKRLALVAEAFRTMQDG